MSKDIRLITFATLLVTLAGLSVAAQKNTPSATNQPQNVSAANAPTDRDQDGLLGPVKTIKTEIAKLSRKAGNIVEGTKATLETATYDIKGTKTDTQYFPIGGSVTGKETYVYDKNGNISEMTLSNADGTLLTKETYTYDYDFMGNWTKMTTSVAIIEGGKLGFDQKEVSYRTIAYFVTADVLVKMKAAENATAAVASTATTNPPVANTTAAPVGPTLPTNMNPTLQINGTAGKTSIGGTDQSAAARIVDATKPVETKQPEVKNTVVDTTAKVTLVETKPAQPEAKTPETKAPETKLAAQPDPNAEAVVRAPIVPRIMKPISGGVLNGQALSLPQPAYPELAKRTHIGGVVKVEVVIDETGKVISARAVEGNPLLQQAAIDAARRAKFSITKLSGVAVKVSGSINYSFTF